MHLFQNAAQRFRYYYNTYRPFERDATLRAGQGELVYLDDYIMGCLAALAPNARKDEWLSLWEARNEAVVTPE